MIVVKNKKAIAKMREAGKRLSLVFKEVMPMIKAGMSTADVNRIFTEKLREAGLVSACKGYGGYPAETCVSVNEVIVHGIPREDVILKPGDLVKVDIVARRDGYLADMARYKFIEGAEPAEEYKLVAEAVSAALKRAKEVIRDGLYLGELSKAIEEVAEQYGVGIVKTLAGHGVGKQMHEDPQIPNYFEGVMGPKLQAGMTIAVEPMFTAGSGDVVTDEVDGWTIRSREGVATGHIEDTILVTSGGCEVLTDWDIR